MLGIGPTELVVVAVLFLIIFGPSKMPQMARDIGKFVNQARGAIDEFKDELTSEDPKDASNSPARSREEGSQRRKNARAESNGHRREDEDSDDLEDEPNESPSREKAEYDL
ncbi:hypothetical protein BH24ACT16_BH24ACT16_11910 [soil metagenome]|jgi:Tat protein translocase TatB subunit